MKPYGLVKISVVNKTHQFRNNSWHCSLGGSYKCRDLRHNLICPTHDLVLQVWYLSGVRGSSFFRPDLFLFGIMTSNIIRSLKFNSQCFFPKLVRNLVMLHYQCISVYIVLLALIYFKNCIMDYDLL